MPQVSEKDINNSPDGSDITNDEVIMILAALQSGDEKDFSRLLEIYEPLISHMAASAYERFRDIGAETDDLRQEAVIALYKAASAYDIGQSDVTFGLYAKICIKNRLISVSRRLSRASKAKRVAKKERAQTSSQRTIEIPETLLSQFSDYERSVWKLYALGESYADMARTLGRGEKSIENALYRIRAKLKGAMR